MPTPPNSKRTLAEDLGDLETIIVPPLKENRHNFGLFAATPESNPEIGHHPECFQCLCQFLPFIGLRQDGIGWLGIVFKGCSSNLAMPSITGSLVRSSL
jgi:hypothetical protein